ncbi:MAG: hypothetical protein N3A65_10100 [candidate division WOR-3 bacterium]|nr:hypothetical protein [candidate division WOR-3 bacterium]
MKYLQILFGWVLMVSLSRSDQSTAPFYTRIGVTAGSAKVDSELMIKGWASAQLFF